MAGFCPFPEDQQLVHELARPAKDGTNASRRLPGYPHIKLEDYTRVAEFLDGEFLTPVLDQLAPHLWMMSTQSSANIKPLHEQLTHGRRIVVTEDPSMHLVWLHSTICVKPLPKYLASYAFWADYFCKRASPKTIKAALGLLRTYRFLVKYESDFWLAEQHHLVPADVTWEDFCYFSEALSSIDDAAVSPRYQYGELRLTRLNFYIKLILHKRHFRRLDLQYSDYFARYYGPLLFIFGMLSLLLSAMQVEMAVETVSSTLWPAMWAISRYVSVVCLVWLVIVLVSLTMLLSYKWCHEWVYAIRVRRRKKLEGRSPSPSSA